MRPPAGFEERPGARGSRVWVRGDLAPLFTDHDLLPRRGAPAAALDARALPGRGGAFAIGWPGLEGRLAFRRLLHGGLLRSVTADRFWGRTPRPFAEVELSEWLLGHAIATPTIVFAVVRRAPSGIYRGAVATRWIEGGRDLAETLEMLAAGGESVDSPRVCTLWRAVGSAVRRMHETGVVHADLNLRNLMVTGSQAEPVPWVLDLDCSRRAARISGGAREANLARLDRSLRKFPGAARLTGAAARDALRAGYCEALPVSAPGPHAGRA